MAYDGIAAAAVAMELNNRLQGGSIAKIAQPEKDELLLTVRAGREQVRVTISANPSAPLVYTRDDSVASPLTAPNFCMCLRKHMGGGRIAGVYQPASDFVSEGLERVIVFIVDHRDEMGEPGRVYLSCELMGKHSNIILLDKDLTIIDSIRHISHMTSSVREVLPGRKYFIPDALNKKNPRTLYKDREAFISLLKSEPEMAIYKKLYMSVTGISPVVSGEILLRAGADPERPACDFSHEELGRVYDEFASIMGDVEEGRFAPNIVYDGETPSELSPIILKSLEGGGFKRTCYASFSEAVRRFYSEKELRSRIRAKSEDIRGILKVLTERASKKLDLLEKQYSDTEKRDKYRLYGELINIYGYSLKGGEAKLTCEDYNSGETVEIPLDGRLSAAENAAVYFEKYQKLKRTRAACAVQIKECRDQLYHLESISSSLSLCVSDADLDELRREMAESGYIKKAAKAGGKKKAEPKSKPLHFVSSDGIDIYVGRNNYQNEELDFKIADKEDWWFHAKNIPGSHVIAKTGARELPDKTCLEAAALAAYYAGSGRDLNAKVEVDYVKRKELKRVPGAKPGFVIYHTNYSIMIEPKSEI